MPANFGGKSEKEFFRPTRSAPVRGRSASWKPDSNITLKAEPALLAAGQALPRQRRRSTTSSDQNQQILQLTGGQVTIDRQRSAVERRSLKKNSNVRSEPLPLMADGHPRVQREAAAVQGCPRPPRYRPRDRPRQPRRGDELRDCQARRGFFPPSLRVRAIEDAPALSYSLSAAKAELKKSKYPNGFDTKLLI